MAVAQVKLSAVSSGSGMDQPIAPTFWTRWSLGVRVAVTIVGIVVLVGTGLALVFGDSVRTVRMPVAQITLSPVEKGIFHDLIPLRAKVVPRDTVYLDAAEGGLVQRVLVQPGERVTAGQPMIEFGNTNLQLQVIQQESTLNQAISQLEQNEINLEQNKIANDRNLATIDYNIVRLKRSLARRQALVQQGYTAEETRDLVSDELNYDQQLRPMQVTSNDRQEALRLRLLPTIHDQIAKLQMNLEVVHSKLDNLIVRAPVAGQVTAIDLKTGENRNAGGRLAEITPDTGYKLSADVDEFYLPRVRQDQVAEMDLAGQPVKVRISRIYPQVKDGRFTVELEFVGGDPANLVGGQAMQGRLALGDDTPAVVLAAGAFLERTGGDWAFVANAGDSAADRRRIKIGRRNTEQVEIVDGLKPGEKVVTSDYTGLERIDRIVLTK